MIAPNSKEQPFMVILRGACQQIFRFHIKMLEGLGAFKSRVPLRSDWTRLGNISVNTQ